MEIEDMPRTLIIEDTPDTMKRIIFILHRNGYDTLEDETGRKGIELALAKPRPDFIPQQVVDQIHRIIGGEEL